MLLTLHPNWWDDWLLYHQVTFDGPNRRILVNEGVTEYSVRRMYSSWKEWFSLRDNSKFLPAFRNIGGDPTSGNLLAGDIYFLINDWQVVISGQVEMQGVLYSDNAALKPYIVMPGGGITSTVSNLVQTVMVDGAGPSGSYPTPQEIRQEIDSNSTQLAAIRNDIGTVASQVRTELTPELTKILLLESGLTETQATMLSEIYNLYGLNPLEPLVVTNTSRTAGDIQQTITSNANVTTVTRQL